MLKGLFDPNSKEFKKCEKIADAVLKLEKEYSKLSDDKLKKKTDEFKNRINKGETLDNLIVDAFATVREASKRVTGKHPFKVQIIGATAIHGGNIAEMKTGEGKTLTSVMPAYLNALSGKGVHIITVNEYLASREANGEIGELFRWLGLTVGLNLREYSKQQKKEQYLSDILYSTHAEIGFDYLRDNMILRKEELVQRELNYAIIDEVDSVLIDEARTPLIISGGTRKGQNLYTMANTYVKTLKPEDYSVDIETKHVVLTDSGIEKAQKGFNLNNLYDIQHVNLTHHINNALRAHYIMQKDVEYVVNNGVVEIVDQFTGRILKGRQFSEGLHQAIEAKEGVEIKQETETMANITYQNLFRMYSKLSGMTGTAKTEEEEFIDIYNMFVIEIPTNKPIARIDAKDYIFLTKDAKYNAIVKEIKERNSKGQPILVGTIAVETSELISKKLIQAGIKHEILNAKNHFKEAEIIEKAGEKSSVTIATNMAGRGTDIKITEDVKKLGGLAVIGTERHESRRIDNQLRGRSGRQGDVGYSRFYLSTEDELLERFGSAFFKNAIATAVGSKNIKEEKPLESRMISSSVKGAQRKIEGHNYDARKNVLKYDDVLRKQREIIYKQRFQILTSENIEDSVMPMIDHAIETSVNKHIDKETNTTNYDTLFSAFDNAIFPPSVIKKEEILNLSGDSLIKKFKEITHSFILAKKETVPTNVYNEFLKVIVLRVVDQHWRVHLDAMKSLRRGVSLQAYGQGNPLLIYQEEGFKKFSEMNESIARNVAVMAVRSKIEQRIAENAMRNSK